MKRLYSVVPMGREVRKFAALILIIRGFLYVFDYTGPRAVLPYERWSLLTFPLWAYGAIMIIAGLALVATINCRHCLTGRIATIGATALCAFLAGGALGANHVQASTYVLLVLCGIREAAITYEVIKNDAI